jgi:hypothetical protein
MELDPLLREMWLTHARTMQTIRNVVNLIGWIVGIFAVLSWLGGYLWYKAVENGTIPGGF